MRTLSIIFSRAILAFGLIAATAHAGITGHWDFNGGLTATIGTDLQAQGIAVAGSQFGTTAGFGIADIGGQVGQVMRFPQMPTSADGYKMFPGAAANGSTGDVNRYSLIIDILYPSGSTGYRALFQTSAGNSNDGDWFVNPDNGLGINGAYNGILTPDTWHRIALVVDLEQADAGLKFRNYIDGSFVGSSDLGAQGAPGGRFSVWPNDSGNPSWIFSDEDGETALGFVNSVQFRDYAMSDLEIAALGGPSALGIAIPEPAAGLLLSLGFLALITRIRRIA